MKRLFATLCCGAVLCIAGSLAGCTLHSSASSAVLQPPSNGGGSSPYIIQSGGGGGFKVLTDNFANQTTLGEATASQHGSQPGFIWFADPNNSSIDQINELTDKITDFKTPISSQLDADTLGPDGRIWFFEYKGTAIYAMETSSPFDITSYSVMFGGVTYYPTSGLVTGPDGNIWYAGDNGTSNGYVGVMSPSGTMLAAYALTPGCPGVRIAKGPDGNLWVSTGCSIIERVTPAGVVTPFTVPNNDLPWYVIAGPDGNVYFTIAGSVPRFGKVDIKTGVVSEITSPSDFFYNGTGLIVVGTQIWFVDELNSGFNAIGRFNVTTQKFMTPINLPSAVKDTRSQFFAMGYDGNVYFTNSNGKVGVRILKVLTISPRGATIGPGGTQTITVSETNYSGSWTASSDNTNVATVAPGSSNTFVVTGHNAGTAKIKIVDGQDNSAICIITVT